MGSKLRTCVLILIALCAAVAPAQAQNGTISGRVTAADGGNPLAGARVQARQEGRVEATTITNADGRYRLSVDPGSYDVVATGNVGFEEVTGPTVNVTPGGAVTADFTLRVQPQVGDPLIVTANRGTVTRATEAPAHVEVISEREIRVRPAITPVDHLRAIPGIDVISQGVQSTNVVARGFNNIFSGSLHTLTDHRLASVPSLRVNVLHFVPSTDEDLERIEVVLGPGAALYGPNTASGVLHMLTRSPLTAPGTSASILGGERGMFQGTMRTAHRLNDQVGVKLSGQFLMGDEWGYVDPDEVAERQKFAADPFFRQDLINSTGITPAQADARIETIGNRDNDVQRWSGEARVDWQPSTDLAAVFQTGVTNVGSGIELTGLGAAQVDDWRYMYYQARANLRRTFAQIYYNTSNAGDTYLLRTGQPITDESTLLVGQLQHGFHAASWQDFIVGADYFKTNPQTDGTINGIYEDEDETTEVGGYIQSQTTLSKKLDIVLAGRIDDHSALPDLIFSPRAAAVFKPVVGQAFRATYNRAFSTPTSLNQFLDLPTAVPDQATKPLNAAAARLGYSVRVQGTGTTGFNFRQADGSYLMRSPFNPAGSTAFVPAAGAAAFFPATIAVAAARGAFATQPQLGQYLATLRPTPAQITADFVVSGGTPTALSSLTLDEIAPIRETTTTTYELGYQGLIKDRLKLSVDLWRSEIDDFVTPLTISTPFITLNGPSMVAYLTQRFITDLNMAPATAQATATALAVGTPTSPGLAAIPVGVISSTEVNASGAQLLATYTNVNETLDVSGVDLGAQYFVTDDWSVSVTGSLVTDDYFDTSVGIVTLNAPKKKGSLGVEYRPVTGNFNGEVRARYNDDFPVKSGVYEATACLEGSPAGALPCVESFTLLDLNVGYSLPQFNGASIQLSVQNILDEEYRSFPGTPNIGRLALLRLRYEFQ